MHPTALRALRKMLECGIRRFFTEPLDESGWPTRDAAAPEEDG